MSEQTRFYNPYELNAEYILIPGGKHRFSVTNQDIEVPPVYFARFPVTNKNYRRFLDYLSKTGKSDIVNILPFSDFEKSLLKKAKTIDGFARYLSEDSTSWAEKLRAADDRHFGRDDQPVVMVNWFAAAAYCHWLAQIPLAGNLAFVYQLPTEAAWEWAAAGRGKGGKPRLYPWGDEKPDDSRANYDQIIGHTTGNGYYPAGYTPEGLSDMGGNVWELTKKEPQHGKLLPAPVLRGGSWVNEPEYLRCDARVEVVPARKADDTGFRVVYATQ